MKKEKIKEALAPAKLTGLKLKAPATYAAGLKGVTTALGHAMTAMGPVRAMQTLAKLNQKNGFDCPGCAWPDPDDKRSLFAEYCENGAKAIAEEATLKRTGPDFFAQKSISELAMLSDYELGKSGRLTHPMIKRRDADYYEEATWEECFALIADELKALNNPNEAIFYTSGRSSNEAAFLWGLFARALGTNNMPDCSNMCHESSGVALTETLGIGKGSVTLDDLHKAEIVIVIGQNPGTNHPRMLSALQECKANGGKIITINPLEEAGLKRFKNPQKPLDYFTQGTTISDIFLQVKINEDIALLKAIIKGLYTRHLESSDVFDQEFIDQNTSGFQELIEDLSKYDQQELYGQCGVPPEKIEEAIDLLANKQKVIICWAMGLTQHKNGVENIRECVNLLLLKGSIGKEGTGTCPVRGHSNVQGDRTVGIMHHVSPKLNAAIKDVFGFDPPSEMGLDTVHCIQAMYEHKAKVFMALGGNFLSAASDTYYTAEALSHCNLTVQISTKLNRSHLVTGEVAIILPTLGRSEKDFHNGKERKVSVENSMGIVHSSKGHLEPASDKLMSEPDIIAYLAHHTLGDKYGIDWIKMGSDYALIREKIAQIIDGFNGYNHHIEKDTSFYLPNNARQGDFSKMPDGRAQLTINPVSNYQLEKDEFILMTIRSHDQFNTTIYGLDDRYRGIYGERRVLFMNPHDMNKLNLQSKELVNITSTYDGIERKVFKFHVIPYSIPQGNLAGYFPEMNPLVPIDQFAIGSQTPISKSVRVRVLKR